jgi:predicted small lipoprotein YifL
VIARSPRLCRAGIAVFGLCALAACGKKGPPLAPLRYVPAAPADVQARRTGNEVRLQFVLPTANVQGQGRIELDRLEVFAVTVGPDSGNPPNRDLLADTFRVGTIEAKPAPREGDPAPPAGAPPDTRPGPGERATFVEELNEAKLTPQLTISQAPAVVPATPSAATAAAVAAAAKEKPVTRRIYVVRGLTRGGRPGQPSQRVVLPIVQLPAPPAAVDAKVTENAVTLSWLAPLPGLGETPPTFNVYLQGEAAPLNAAPLSSTVFERPGVTFGTEQCFVVRTAVVSGNATLESAPSEPRCVTPADVFPPAAPKGLSAVGVSGAVNLIWEANSEADLAGYLVLRGEAPGDTLQAITTTPITETTYRDATAVPGVRYVYAVVAVDRAAPPNTSAQSNRVEESAR